MDALDKAVETAGLPAAVAMLGCREGVRLTRTYGAAHETTIFQIASMTKAIVSVAALQLVDDGKLSLDDPVAPLLPELADPMVIAGFDDDGAPRLRPAARPITLRHLLTHSSGLGYSFVSETLARAHANDPSRLPGTLSSILPPLLFDPGSAWEYGVGTDWAGRAVEAASGVPLGKYLSDHVTGPIGMTDTTFWPADLSRLAPLHARGERGIEPLPLWIGGGESREFDSGGGGLFSTAPDYMRFLRMILNGGALDGVRIVSDSGFQLLTSDLCPQFAAGSMATVMPALALPYDPGDDCGWSAAFLVARSPGEHGRAAGSLSWAGIANCYYWIDPASDVCGVFMTQLLPFADPDTLAAFAALERLAYRV